MQINYLHYYNKACNGYTNYLNGLKEGNWIKFCPQFFFFQTFYLVYHKMYRETFLYSMLFSFYFSLSVKAVDVGYGNFEIHLDHIYLSFILIFLTLIVSPFLFFPIFKEHNERILHSVNYNSSKFIKKITPYSNIDSTFIMLLGYLLTVWNFFFFFILFLVIKSI